MSNRDVRADLDPDGPDGPDVGPPSRALVALSALLLLEAAAMAAVALFLIVEIFASPAKSVASAVALSVCAAIAAAGLVAIGVGAWRRAKWIRAAALVWQILQVIVGINAFQGIQPRPDIGTALIVPALAVILLLFTKSVMQATRRV